VSRDITHGRRFVPLLWIAAFATLIWALLRVSRLRAGASFNSSKPYPAGWAEVAPEYLAIEALKLMVLVVATWLLLVTLVSVLLFNAGYVHAASRVVRLMPRAMQAVVRPALAITLTTSMLLPSVSAAGAIESGARQTEAVLIHLGSTDSQPEAPSSPETPRLPDTPGPPDAAPSPEGPPTIGAAPAPDPTTESSPTMQPDSSSEAPTGPNVAELTHLDGRTAVTADGQDNKAVEGRGGFVDDSTEPARSGSTNSASVWIVEPGEHLWSISERVVAEDTSRSASHAEVGRYWLLLIEANRASLPDPENPDLIYPGMRLRLPPGGVATLGLGPAGSQNQPS